MSKSKITDLLSLVFLYDNFYQQNKYRATLNHKIVISFPSKFRYFSRKSIVWLAAKNVHCNLVNELNFFLGARFRVTYGDGLTEVV